MKKQEPTTRGRTPLSAGAAFVVHLTDDGLDAPEALQGRVEHVLSGRSLRFGSVSDLVGFMQRVLANATRNNPRENT